MPYPHPPELYPGSMLAGIGQWWTGLSDGHVAVFVRDYVTAKRAGLPDEVIRAYRFDVAEMAALDQFRRYASGRDPVPVERNCDPRERALKWISPGKYTDLIPPLVPLLSFENQLLRRQAARHLTAYGDAALLAHLPAALKIDRDMAVGVIDGFKTARLAGRAGTLYRQALYPLVETFVNQRWHWMGWDEPLEPALLHLDPEKGRDILLPRFDDFEGNDVSSAITAFVEMPHLIDSAILFRLIEEDAREDLPPHKRGSRFGGALQVLAALRHPSTPALISEALIDVSLPEEAHHTEHSRISCRQSGAADALGIWHRFKLEHKWLLLRQHFLPRCRMTPVEADLDNALEAAICCDGIEQYLVTSTGDDWQMDQAALDRMGTPLLAATFRKLCAVFGPDGPSVDTSQRCEQIDSLGEKAEEAMKDFEKAWDKCPESPQVKRQVYAINHREELAALPDPRSFSW